VTTSVSAAELADLFADLGLNTPAAAPPEPRCDVTDLLVSACAHCRPAPPAEASSTRLGPWFAATYAGTCAGCGGQLERGDRIRADGDGGYLGDCCGNISAAAPPVVDAQALIATAAQMVPAGPPPSTVTVMRDVLTAARRLEAPQPAEALGPSEIGTPCQRQLA
jgi:hypothetical protein